MPDLIPAYILHSRRYGDSSVILECLTQTDGRVAVLAKGGLKDKRRQQLLQPFTPLLMQWRGRGELPTLLNLEAADKAFNLPGKRLYCGMYINEIVVYLTAKHDPNVDLFAEYCLALESLASGQEIDTTLRRFELRLLQLSGHIGSLQHDAAGEELLPTQYYRYDKINGLIPCIASEVNNAIIGSSLLALQASEFQDDQQRHSAKIFMRQVLAEHLHGRPLKSRELFQGLSAPPKTTHEFKK